MAYPEDKEDFTPVASPEWIKEGHINELQTLLETLQDILGTFPNYVPENVEGLGEIFITKTQLTVVEVRAVSGAGLLLRDNNAALGVFVEHGGNVGIKKVNPLVELDVDGEINSTYGFYHDRGDVANWDFDLGDITTDWTWRELDLSGIVPAGVKAVSVIIGVNDDAADSIVHFGKNGNNGGTNETRVMTMVANVTRHVDAIIAVDGDRKIEYKATNTTWTVIELTVKGWWK